MVVAHHPAGSVFCSQQIGQFTMNSTSFDIFCHVIDNFGDAGVAYRFATELGRFHTECRVRVFIDSIAVLADIDPSITPGLFRQKRNNIEFIDSLELDVGKVEMLGCADVLVELFGCYTPECYLEKALFTSTLIINLEYLSAETWGAGYHLKESLLPKGTVKKYFFMPGFIVETGGLLFNSNVAQQVSSNETNRRAWVTALLQQSGSGAVVGNDMLIGTIFTYERGFDTLITDLDSSGRESLLLCFGQKSRSGMEQTFARLGTAPEAGLLRKFGNVTVTYLPSIPQYDYDTLLCYADFNLVRGEDSLVQAINAGKPLVWNAYLQDEKYQQVKVGAFCAEFKKYIDDPDLFAAYRELLLQFNDAAIEAPVQKTTERFTIFFRDLKKIEHATAKMSYFIRQNCNLVQKFSEFIRDFPKNT